MSAQTPPTNPKQHLEYLCQEIGARPIGSKANQQAVDYIQQVFEVGGYTVESQSFDCPAWECAETLLEMGSQQLTAVANAFSPPCDVTALAVAVGTLAELETAVLTDKIGILYGDLTKETISPRGWFLMSEREQRLLELLEQKQPAALITVNPRRGIVERVIEDWQFAIPSATVAAEVGLSLLRQATPKLRLKIDSRSTPGKAANLVATKAGTNPARIVLCAHFDTKIDTPGAFDNGGGTAVLLTLAERFANMDLPVGLEFIAFNGEDLGPGLGDQLYINQRGNQLEEIIAAINMDGVGQCIGATSITTIAGSDALQAVVDAIVAPYPGVVQVDPWPESNHSTFSFRGVPAIALTSIGGANLAHDADDTIKWISPQKLDDVVSLVASLVEALQDKSAAWSRDTAV